MSYHFPHGFWWWWWQEILTQLVTILSNLHRLIHFCLEELLSLLHKWRNYTVEELIVIVTSRSFAPGKYILWISTCCFLICSGSKMIYINFLASFGSIRNLFSLQLFLTSVAACIYPHRHRWPVQEGVRGRDKEARESNSVVHSTGVSTLSSVPLVTWRTSLSLWLSHLRVLL